VTITRLRVVTTVAVLLLAIFGTSSEARQSQRPSGAHNQTAVEESHGLANPPSRVPTNDPSGHIALYVWSGR
jgi:hypothetical protein